MVFLWFSYGFLLCSRKTTNQRRSDVTPPAAEEEELIHQDPQAQLQGEGHLRRAKHGKIGRSVKKNMGNHRNIMVNNHGYKLYMNIYIYI